ncbi:MAG: TonB-dependent receptor [Novosphingobium sp.]|nr:TonB-dependent receptor [Novosphingobium sp.]
MSRKIVLLGASALALIATPALADDTDIIVTARKQQESILKVPVVVAALGEMQIERAQIKDLTDVAKKVTGLQFGVASVESGNLVSMRGYGTNALDPGVDASVSLNIDGMQITQGMAYAVGFFDMAQVEVLKGPQALFFGKASPAGVISVRTADPGDETEVIARSGYEFVANEWRNELIFSSPLSETVGIRLAGMYDDFGGFFRNTATPNTPTGQALGALPMPKRFGETESIMFRGTLVWKPSSDVSARLKVNITRDSQIGSQAGQLIDCPDGVNSIFFSLNEDCKATRTVNIVGLNPAAFPGMVPFRGGRPAVLTRQKFGTLELNYNMSPALTLTSVTGYYWMKTAVDFNCSYSGQAASGCMTTKRLKRRDFTQELRLTSDFAGPFNFTLGGFYQDGTITNDLVLAGNVALFGSPAFARLFDGTHDVDIRAISLFGQGRYQVTPQFEIAAGARWTDEKRRSTPTSVDIFGAVTGVPGSIITDFAAEMPPLRAKNWSPELTLTWTPTDDLTIFGSLKQAYKSGSYNIVLAAQKGRPDSFGDERIRGGEIGLKARLADRQINFNIAGYYYKVNGMQVQVILPFAGVIPVLTTLNAASSKIYGIDADITYRPNGIEGLEIFAAINWNHARFTKFIAPCDGGQTFAAGCNLNPAPVNDAFPAFTDPALFNGAPFRYTSRDLSGARLARAPDWAGNIGFHYERPIGSGLAIGVGGDAQFASKYAALLGSDDQSEIFQKAYAKLNFHLSLKDENDAWEVAFIGNNLTNKMTLSNVSKSNFAGGSVLPGLISGGPALGPAGLAETAGVVDRGRELWIRLTLRPMRWGR